MKGITIFLSCELMYKQAPLWSIVLLHFLLFHGRSTVQAQSTAEPYVVSKRVGAEIDQKERTYFGLFPGIDGFLSATAHVLTDSTVAFTVTQQQHDRRQDTLLVYRRAVVDELSRYVNRFEQLYQNTAAVEWGLLLQVARPVRRFRNGVTLTITKRDGTQAEGRLLYIDERLMVLSRADHLRDRLTNAEKAELLFPHEIKHVRDRWPLHKRILGEINIPGAGNEKVYHEHTVPRLKQHAAFRSAPSPEIDAFIQNVLRQQQPLAKEMLSPIPVDAAYLKRLEKTFHMTLSFHPFTAMPGFQRYTIETYLRGAQQYPVGVSAFSSTPLGIDYSLSRKIRAGARLQYLAGPSSRGNMPEEEVRVEDQSELARAVSQVVNHPGSVQISGIFISGLLTYAVKPYDQLAFLQRHASAPFAPFEIVAGVGPSLAFMSVDTELVSAVPAVGYYPAYIRYGAHFTDHQTVPGATALLEASFYFSSYLSAGVGTRTSFYPNIVVADRELPDPMRPSRPKTLTGFTESLLLNDVSFGIRLHL